MGFLYRLGLFLLKNTKHLFGKQKLIKLVRNKRLPLPLDGGQHTYLPYFTYQSVIGIGETTGNAWLRLLVSYGFSLKEEA